MLGFRQIWRAAQFRQIFNPQATTQHLGVWNEVLEGGFFERHFCVVAPATTEAASCSVSVPHVSSSLSDSSPPNPPPTPTTLATSRNEGAADGAVFLQSLEITMEEWEKIGGDRNITKDMDKKMELLNQYKLPLERKRKMVMDTKHRRDLFRRVTPKRLEDRVKYLVNEFGFSEHDAAIALSKHPTIMNYSLENNIGKFMTLLEDAGATRDELKDMIKAHPQIVGYRTKFQNLTKVLEDNVGMSQQDVAALIIKYPRILSYSITNGLEPTIKKLGEYGLTKEEISSVVLRAPKLISWFFNKMVDEKLDWLQSTLGLSDEEALNVLKIQPVSFYARLEAWAETQEWFQGLGKSREEFVQILKDCDFGVLGRRSDGLQDMLEFALNVLKKDQEEVMNSAAYFGTNFMVSTMPRIACLDHHGKDITKYSLDDICKASDEELFKDLDLDKARKFMEEYRSAAKASRMQAFMKSLQPSSMKNSSTEAAAQEDEQKP